MIKIKRLLNDWWDGFKVCMFVMIVCFIFVCLFFGIPYLLFYVSPWLCGACVLFINMPLFGYMMIHSGD